MQRPILFLLALCSAAGAGAQQDVSYGGFLVSDTSVRWAAEADKVVALVPRMLPQSLNRFYRRQLDSGRLHTYTATIADLRVRESGRASRATLAAPEPFSDFTRAYKDLPPVLRRRIDTSSGQGISCDTCSDIELFRVRQLLYLKNGRFYVDNVLVSPLEGGPDSSGAPAWGTRFSTSFYKGGTAPRSYPKDRIYLGTAIVNYQFAYEGPRGPADERILSLQEPNPIYPLLEAARRGRVKLRNELRDSKPVMNPRTFFADFGTTDTTAVYDVTDPGKVSSYVVTQSNLEASGLAVYGIEQSFYFDTRLQVLFSEVHKVTIKSLVYQPDGSVRGRRAIASVTYSPAPASARQRVEAWQDNP